MRTNSPIFTSRRIYNGSATNIIIFVIFFVLSAISRKATFFFSTLDWDESLYFLMAERWRAGWLPYTALWDNKPIGIYAILAIFQTVLGDQIAAMRIAAVSAVTATSFMVYHIVRCLVRPDTIKSKIYGIFAGILYILSSLCEGGMASNTELFVSPFVCLGLYLSLTDNRRSMRRVYLTGLALGAACMVKYVAVFEAPIPLAMLMINAGHDHGGVADNNRKYLSHYKQYLFVILEYTVGIATPVIIVSAFYIASGHLTDFIDASLRSNFRRLEVPFSFKVASMALHDEARVWPVLNLATLISLIWSVGQTIKRVRLDTSPHERTTFIFLLFWVLGTAIGVSSAKSFFPHYFLQMLPALSVTTAWVLSRIFSFESTATIWRYLLALSFILIQPVLTAKDRIDRVMLAINENTIDGIGMLHDVPAKIAANIKPILGENSNKTIYVVDYEPVIYSLAGIAPPTKYAFPPFLVQPPLSYVAGVDPILEVKAILAKCPVFIIRASRRPPGANNEGVYEFIDHAIARDYETWLIYDEATIYRRRADR